MPIYEYRGKTKTGDVAQGCIEARNPDEAVELISRQDILPVSVAERKRQGVGRPSRTNLALSFKETYLFTRQLSNLIKSGIPILKALEIIKKQSPRSMLVFIIDDIRQGISDGRSFSDCLADHPKVFSSLYVAMVRVGEEGGNLRQILLTIADHQRTQNELLGKVRTALAYPVFMAGVGFLTIIFILTFVMPKISQLFINAGQHLPLPTQFLMATSKILRQGWFIIFPLVVLLIFSCIRWAQSRNDKRMLDRILLRMPLLGPFLLNVELARFCRTLEILIHSGVPLLKALQVAVPTLTNELIRQDFLRIKVGLEAGNSLSKSFQDCQFIPSMIVSLITVGEESGLLEDTLRDIADNYEQEVSDAVKAFTAILEPLMILIVGAIVGFIVIAMLLPIFQMDVLAQ
ncbi:MAG TPA: type II secretion system F family protein [Candidatus Omnitrophota bacterium]|nr:type II secretion system F family protein [Candidatus Omnitrophota bacterium]